MKSYADQLKGQRPRGSLTDYKRVSTLLLCFVLCAVCLILPAAGTDYNLWVNNTQVTDEQLTITCGSGTAEFVPATSTLTLTDADITKGCEIDYLGSGILSRLNDLNIVFVGENRITETGGDGISTYSSATHNLTCSGTGNITIVESTEWYGYGIYCTGNLTLDGVEIDITSNASGLWAGKDLKLRDSKVTINVGPSAFNGLVTNTGTITLDNTTLDGTTPLNLVPTSVWNGTDFEIKYISSSAILLSGRTTSHLIVNSGTINLSGYYGIEGSTNGESDIIINGGSLNITAGEKAIHNLSSEKITIASGLKTTGSPDGKTYIISSIVSADICNATTQTTLTDTTVSDLAYKGAYTVSAKNFKDTYGNTITAAASDYTWKSDDTAILSVSKQDNGNAAIIGLTPGKTNVSLLRAADGKILANVTFDVQKAVLTSADFTLTPLSAVYTGSDIVVSVTEKSEGMGTISNITYNKKENASALGTYTIRVNVTEGANYTAASQTEAGTFTITPKSTPVSSGGGEDTGAGNYDYYPRTVTDGGEVNFGTSPVVSGVTLPKGTSGDVILIAKSGEPAPAGHESYLVFEINIPHYIDGTAAEIKFHIPIAELEKTGHTAADICLYHKDAENWNALSTTYTITDGIAYYTAATRGFSPFAIIFEQGAALKQNSVIIDPVVTQTPAPAKTAEPLTTTAQPVTTTAPEQTKSPAGIISLLAGLGAAIFILRKNNNL